MRLSHAIIRCFMMYWERHPFHSLFFFLFRQLAQLKEASMLSTYISRSQFIYGSCSCIIYVPNKRPTYTNNDKYSTWIIYIHFTETKTHYPFHTIWGNYIESLSQDDTIFISLPLRMLFVIYFSWKRTITEKKKKIWRKKSTIKILKEWWAVEKWTVEQRTTAHASDFFHIFDFYFSQFSLLCVKMPS